jgi:hypothetical protein
MPLAAGAACALAVGAGSAQGAVNIGGWGAITADMAGGALVWADAQPAKTKTFTYWRAEASRARVSGNRLSGVTKPVIVRTSAGPLTATDIRAMGTGSGFTLAASGSAFPGPVVWCCTTEGLEIVVSSDSDGAAPRPLASGLDGTRVRWIGAGAGGTFLGAGDPVELAAQETSAPLPGRTGPGLASLAAGIAAWADTGGTSIRMGVPSDSGVADIRTAAQGGRVLAVRAVPGVVAAVVRAGSGFRVTRTDAATGRVTVVWRGSTRPQIAVGGRAIAIGAGTKVFTSRGGAARPAGEARGPIAAVATDGARVAVFERVTRKAKSGARATTVRSTGVRILGRVR